jgi:Amt family ammonium transporter
MRNERLGDQMTRLRIGLAGVSALLLCGVAGTASAAAAAPEPALLAHQATLALDGAATAWILTSTALVLLMTLPGLALP